MQDTLQARYACILCFREYVCIGGTHRCHCGAWQRLDLAKRMGLGSRLGARLSYLRHHINGEKLRGLFTRAASILLVLQWYVFKALEL